MAINVTLAQGGTVSSSVANQTMNFTVTVANTGSSSVTLTTLDVQGGPGRTATVSQPVYLTPNTPVGVGNPAIAASSSATYGFQCVFTNPAMPGPSPQAPGGAAPSNAAFYPRNTHTLTATSLTSDGTIASGSIVVPVLSATIPQDNGGALVLSQGFNLINLVTL